MTATYRLQFTHKFTFRDALELVDYLDELGVSSMYASPLFQCKPGSTHGYDVTDPGRLNPELGSESDFEQLTSRLQQRGLGLLLDIVPNHMSTHHHNRWWMDVLEYGPASFFEHFFDIAWKPNERVILPFLEAEIGHVLEKGGLELSIYEGRFYLSYFDHRFPVTPHSYASILEFALLPDLQGDQEKELGVLCETFAALPIPSLDSQKEWREKGEVLKSQLKSFLAEEPSRTASLKAGLGKFPIRPILDDQAYQLSSWQEGLRKVNYRRFFNIAELVAVKVENPSVFEATHELIFKLVRNKKVTGLRIDHIDGLIDPAAYLEKLRARTGASYLVVEKILLGSEELRTDWSIEGTTGYDFLNKVNGIFVDPGGLRVLKRRYRRDASEERTSFEEVAFQKKRNVIQRLFKAELDLLAGALSELSRESPKKDSSCSASEAALAIQEATAALPVYRTYINGFSVSETDRKYIESALSKARGREMADRRVLDHLENVLLLRFPRALSISQKRNWLQFVMKWQQFTGPVAAKGVEDTALYVYNPLDSLNEVGGEPDMAVSLDQFHLLNQERVTRWPHGLNASTTHDTKRSEDVRARINVLSELAEEWESTWQRWHSLNKSFRRRVEGKQVPDTSMELLLYTTLLGAWPLDRSEEADFQERIEGFVIKAAREGKTFTSWMAPNAAHEDALLQFVANLFSSHNFLEELRTFQKKISFYGMLNSLSQLLLKVCSPGVPDFYQGTELWNFSLVDPDNRRPVDFEQRRENLHQLLEKEEAELSSLASDLLANWKDGRIKLFVTHRCLSFRRREETLFAEGSYQPLTVKGEHADSICAFVRQVRNKSMIVVAPRWWTRIASPDDLRTSEECWKDTRILLPGHIPEQWRDVLTNQPIPAEASDGRVVFVGQLLKTLPVAVLEGDN